VTAAPGRPFALALLDIQTLGAHYRRLAWDDRIAYMTFEPASQTVIPFLGQTLKRQAPGRYVLVLRDGTKTNYELTEEDTTALDWVLVHRNVATTPVAAFYNTAGTEPDTGDTHFYIGSGPINISVSNAVTEVNILALLGPGQELSISGTELITVEDIADSDSKMLVVNTQGIAAAGGTISCIITVSELGTFDVASAFTLTVNPPVEITAFDAIADVDGGTTVAPTYADAAAVIAALPTSVTANGATITVPVTTWADTDTFNPAAAGKYTFTAILGDLPSGVLNTGNYTATVEVEIVSAE
jgi:hypothetical protein